MSQENKDLCKTCRHYWTDFIINPDKTYIAHCEIVDEKYGISVNMDEKVPYPCLKCPFDSYKNKQL